MVMQWMRRRVFGPQLPWWVSLGGRDRRSPPATRSSVDPTLSSVVMACVEYVGRALPSAPIYVMRDGEPVAHPIADLLEYPSDYVSMREMLRAIVRDYITTGNAYLLRPSDEAGRKQTLWYLPSAHIRPVAEGTDYMTAYEWRTPGAAMRVLDPAEVVHIRHGLDSDTTRLGVSPIASVMREVSIDEAASDYTSALLRNGAHPGLLISPRSDNYPMRPADAARVKAQIEADFTGDHRGAPIVMTAPTDVHHVSYSPEQMDISSVRDMPEERVAAVLGLPAAVIGLGTGMQQTRVGATMVELHRQAWQDCIIPMQVSMADQMTLQLLPLGSDLRIEFDRSSVEVLREDKTGQITSLLGAGVITRSEARVLAGYEPGEADDVYMREPMGSFLGAADSGAEEERASPQPIELRQVDDSARLVSDLESVRVQAMGLMQSELVDAFAELGDLVADAWRGTETRAIEDDIAESAIVSDWIDLRLADVFRVSYGRAIQDAAKVVSVHIGRGVSIPDVVARGILADGGKRVGLVDVVDATKRAIFDGLASAREDGLGAVETAERISGRVSAGRFRTASTRALVIARTETKYAQNRSALGAYDASGADRVIAFDAQIGATDADCMARDGQVYDLAEAQILTEAEHPNGTLSWAPYYGEGEQGELV